MMDEVGSNGRRVCRGAAKSTRRDFLAIASAIGADLAVGSAAGPALAEPASDRPQEGDVLVPFDGERQKPFELKDVPVDGPPVFAWPMDPAGNVVRSGSRLNKVLLVRLDPSTLVGVTRERAVEGVVAYSAICPHAGCDVSVWVPDQKTLECSCHYSHYDPRDAAAVIDGPTPRSLAALPLKLADGKLTVAKPFTLRVGIIPT
jgi:rieske iron-sulfur protein